MAKNEKKDQHKKAKQKAEREKQEKVWNLLNPKKVYNGQNLKKDKGQIGGNLDKILKGKKKKKSKKKIYKDQNCKRDKGQMRGYLDKILKGKKKGKERN